MRTVTPLKAVEWAYPSSPLACHFGHAKTGCYVIEVAPCYGAITEAIAAYPDANTAFREAAQRPEGWMWDDQARFAQEVAA